MFALPFHPAVQQILFEAPAITQLKRGYFAFAQILVESVRGYPKILGCLAQGHDLFRSFHFLSCLFPTNWQGLSGYPPCVFPVFRSMRLTAMTSGNKKNLYKWT